MAKLDAAKFAEFLNEHENIERIETENHGTGIPHSDWQRRNL